MADFVARGGCRLRFLEKHFNVVLKERVNRCINLFLSGVLWYNSGEMQDKGNTVCDPTEETNGAAWGTFFAYFLSLFEKHVNHDLQHLCRRFEMQHLDPRHNLKNLKKDLSKLLARKDYSPDLKQGCCWHIINAFQEETVLLHSLSVFPVSEANLLTRLID